MPAHLQVASSSKTVLHLDVAASPAVTAAGLPRGPRRDSKREFFEIGIGRHREFIKISTFVDVPIGDWSDKRWRRELAKWCQVSASSYSHTERLGDRCWNSADLDKAIVTVVHSKTRDWQLGYCRLRTKNNYRLTAINYTGRTFRTNFHIRNERHEYTTIFWFGPQDTQWIRFTDGWKESQARIAMEVDSSSPQN
jgi:hypothetical protein